MNCFRSNHLLTYSTHISYFYLRHADFASLPGSFSLSLHSEYTSEFPLRSPCHNFFHLPLLNQQFNCDTIHTMKINNILLAFTGLFLTALGSSGRACKEGDLQCNTDPFSASILACNAGRWDTVKYCGPAESCRPGPVPTCNTRSTDAAASDDTIKALSGFENPVAKTSDAQKNVSIISSSSSIWTNHWQDIKITEAETAGGTPFINHCSPCIRFNDICKSVSTPLRSWKAYINFLLSL